MIFATTGIRLVPALFHKVYGAITGIISVAIPGPAPRLTRRNMQIHRFDHFTARYRDDHHRLGIDNLWRRGISELHLSVDTRADLAADAQVNDGYFGMCWQAGESKDCKKSG